MFMCIILLVYVYIFNFAGYFVKAIQFQIRYRSLMKKLLYPLNSLNNGYLIFNWSFYWPVDARCDSP